MSEMKHTPGPWEVEEFGEIMGGDDLVCQVVDRSTEAESNANARLIAAAPELLEACRNVLEWLKPNRGAVTPIKEQLKSAIAKATTQPTPK